MVDERYSSGEKAVSKSGCASFDGSESSTREKWLEEVMSRMRGVNCSFARTFYHPGVVDVLKRWQTTSNDPLRTPDYALEFGSFLQVEDPNQMVMDDVRMDSHDRCVELDHQALQ